MPHHAADMRSIRARTATAPACCILFLSRAYSCMTTTPRSRRLFFRDHRAAPVPLACQPMPAVGLVTSQRRTRCLIQSGPFNECRSSPLPPPSHAAASKDAIGFGACWCSRQVEARSAETQPLCDVSINRNRPPRHNRCCRTGQVFRHALPGRCATAQCVPGGGARKRVPGLLHRIVACVHGAGARERENGSGRSNAGVSRPHKRRGAGRMKVGSLNVCLSALLLVGCSNDASDPTPLAGPDGVTPVLSEKPRLRQPLSRNERHCERARTPVATSCRIHRQDRGLRPERWRQRGAISTLALSRADEIAALTPERKCPHCFMHRCRSRTTSIRKTW